MDEQGNIHKHVITYLNNFRQHKSFAPASTHWVSIATECAEYTGCEDPNIQRQITQQLLAAVETEKTNAPDAAFLLVTLPESVQTILVKNQEPPQLLDCPALRQWTQAVCTQQKMTARTGGDEDLATWLQRMHNVPMASTSSTSQGFSR